MSSLISLGLALVCTLAASSAAQDCPWMNAATAGGLLGGDVDIRVTKHGDDATCVFNKRNTVDRLRIEVTTPSSPKAAITAYKARCVSPAQPIRAIGNEALACRYVSGAEDGELVTGRVRDQVFLIEMRIGPSETLDGRAKAIQAAELVAGNLF